MHLRLGMGRLTRRPICGNPRLIRMAATLVFLLLCTLPLKAQDRALQGIAHVAFRVRDYTRSRSFYRTLGFEQAFEFTDPGKPRVAFIKINDRQFIELYEASEGSQPRSYAYLFRSQRHTIATQRLSQRGTNPAKSRSSVAGNLLFVMHDPEGQLLEYTEYLPGSLHSLDKGKHLGQHRISDHLRESSTPAKDVVTQRAFYTAKLGFQPANSGTREFRLPGKSQDNIEFSSNASTEPELTFTVINLRRAARDLRSRGVKLQKREKRIYITDPDGTVIILTAQRNVVGKP